MFAISCHSDGARRMGFKPKSFWSQGLGTIGLDIFLGFLDDIRI